MVWVVSRIRLKVETSITRSHKSIKSDWLYERDLLAGGDLTTLTAASTSAHRVPSTLIVDYEEEEKKMMHRNSNLIFVTGSLSRGRYWCRQGTVERVMKVKSSGLPRSVEWQILPDVSKDRSGFVWGSNSLGKKIPVYSLRLCRVPADSNR